MYKEIEISKGKLSGDQYFSDTVTDTYLVSADFNEVKDDLQRRDLKTIEAAQVWAEEQVEEHLEDW